MTKLRWGNAGLYQIDPARVNSVPVDTLFDRWVPPQDLARRKAARALENAKLLQRSEMLRFKAMIKKFGDKEAVRLGVPQSVVDERNAREAREAARRVKNQASRERRKQRERCRQRELASQRRSK